MTGPATRPAPAAAPLISLTDITEIELLILRRMREMTIGEHRSLAHGSGFDYVGLRSWQSGDRFSSIDWAQSSLTNFSPLMVREYEQPSTATVMVVADASASTRCGINGVPIARGVARAIATIGMSAVFFQDMFGMMTFARDLGQMASVRPRIGRNHVLHCLDAYQHGTGDIKVREHGDLAQTIGGHVRNPCLMPVVSDFLFEDAPQVLRELGLLNARHDVFLVLVDSAFAFEMPDAPEGWVEAYDVETKRTTVVSRGEFGQLADRVRLWQDDVGHWARDAGLDVLRFGIDPQRNLHALLEFVVERRLRRV